MKRREREVRAEVARQVKARSELAALTDCGRMSNARLLTPGWPVWLGPSPVLARGKGAFLLAYFTTGLVLRLIYAAMCTSSGQTGGWTAMSWPQTNLMFQVRVIWVIRTFGACI